MLRTYTLQIIIVRFLHNGYSHSMYQSPEIPEKILSAAFIGNKIAIGTNYDCQLFQIEGDPYIFEKQIQKQTY